MKIKYPDQSEEELVATHGEMQEALYRLRNERKETGKLEKPHEIRAIRKEIARVLTALREKRGRS